MSVVGQLGEEPRGERGAEGERLRRGAVAARRQTREICVVKRSCWVWVRGRGKEERDAPVTPAFTTQQMYPMFGFTLSTSAPAANAPGFANQHGSASVIPMPAWTLSPYTEHHAPWWYALQAPGDAKFSARQPASHSACVIEQETWPVPPHVVFFLPLMSQLFAYLPFVEAKVPVVGSVPRHAPETPSL